MDPFDPQWDFEHLVLNLNEEHRPGSVVAGKTRNALVEAWGLFVGRERAVRELHEAVQRHGSRNQLRLSLRMTAATLSYFERFFSRLPTRGVLPEDAGRLRLAFNNMAPEGQAAFIHVAAELLGDPAALERLSARSALGPLPSILTPALRHLELRDALDELVRHLDGDVTDERTYQDWCDRHSWAFGNAHVVRDDVRQIDTGSIVDLLLPNILGFRDIVELKRPDHQVLGWDSSHGTHYFSGPCSRAIGQVHKYMDRLHDVARDGLEGHPEIVAYHPHATIVIGRSVTWDETKTTALRGLNERLHGVDVMTYDHLLMRARGAVGLLEARTP